MRNGPGSTIAREVRTLFLTGSMAGLSDGQLLERFRARRDPASAEAAFEALVDRHGPMVLGVCRHILRDPHAAEDAFQATFLILVRRAPSIRIEDSLGRWLYGVTHRVARRAKADLRKRSLRETQNESFEPEAKPLAFDLLDLRAVLHEELGRLPRKYRDPVVLCHLEGLTHDEAARRLHWPLGTVRGRLSRARNLLRTRLERRGLALSAGFVAAGLTREATACVVRPSLASSTVKLAMEAILVPSLTAGAVSTSAAALSKGVLRTMFLTKLTCAAGLFSLGVLTAGTGVVLHDGLTIQDPSAGAAVAPVTAEVDPDDPLTSVQETRTVSDLVKSDGELAELRAELKQARQKIETLERMLIVTQSHSLAEKERDSTELIREIQSRAAQADRLVSDPTFDGRLQLDRTQADPFSKPADPNQAPVLLKKLRDEQQALLDRLKKLEAEIEALSAQSDQKPKPNIPKPGAAPGTKPKPIDQPKAPSDLEAYLKETRDAAGERLIKQIQILYDVNQSLRGPGPDESVRKIRAILEKLNELGKLEPQFLADGAKPDPELDTFLNEMRNGLEARLRDVQTDEKRLVDLRSQYDSESRKTWLLLDVWTTLFDDRAEAMRELRERYLNADLTGPDGDVLSPEEKARRFDSLPSMSQDIGLRR